MLKRKLVAPVSLLVAVAGVSWGYAQQKSAPGTLTPQDYIDIQQLVARYAFAIDNCTNNGHDYADLYTPDGWFAPSQGGRLLTKYEGRDRLAEAALGGAKDCAGVPWKGITHMLVNHVIQPSREGAIGKVYLVAIGLDGEPGKVEAQGHYEDVYVKTANGWRFKTRTHSRAPNGTKPAPAGTIPPPR